MRQALILCGGQAKRLRPYSYSLSKASFPFLNLPLMFLSWFYSEQLKANRFLLNPHLFPEQLEDTVDFLSQDGQSAKLFFESTPLGSAGTLFQLKKELKKTKDFVYINADSLFFPTQMNQIFEFEKTFSNSDLEALFFVVPDRQTLQSCSNSVSHSHETRYSHETRHSRAGGNLQMKEEKLNQTYINSKRSLWCDEEFNLKFVGSKEDLSSKELNGLKAFSWTGMALFKSSLLDHLKKDSFDLFQDFINPLLKSHKIKIYKDSSAILLEAGGKESYLEAMSFCLNCLFQSDLSSVVNLLKEEAFSKAHSLNRGTVKKILEECFNRFDFNDNRVGFKNGKIWSQKLKQPVLLPLSVQGLEFLKLQGPAVIGKETCFFDHTILDNSLLDSHIAFSGQLKRDILLKKNMTL